MDTTKGGFLISQIKQMDDDLPIVELAGRTGLAKTTLTNMLDWGKTWACDKML